MLLTWLNVSQIRIHAPASSLIYWLRETPDAVKKAVDFGRPTTGRVIVITLSYTCDLIAVTYANTCPGCFWAESFVREVRRRENQY